MRRLGMPVSDTTILASLKQRAMAPSEGGAAAAVDCGWRRRLGVAEGFYNGGEQGFSAIARRSGGASNFSHFLIVRDPNPVCRAMSPIEFPASRRLWI